MSTSQHYGYALILLSLLGDAGAQAGDAERLFNLSLDELMHIKVTSSSRNPQTTIEAPSSITVFTRREIENMGLTTLGQLLNLVPGVQAMFEPHEGRTNLLLGRGTPEAYGQSFLLLLDGQRLNEHYTGGFTLANRFVPLTNLERVEVIRGPGSALYGGNAFNGVIHLISARDRNDVSVELGQFSARRLSLNASAGHERWHGHAFIQQATDEGEHYTGVFDRFGRQTTTRDPRSAQDLYATVEYGDETFGTGFFRLRRSEHQLEDFYQFGRLSDGINEDFNVQEFWRIGYELPETGGWQGAIAYSRDRVRWRPFARFALQGQEPPTEADWLEGPRLDYRGEQFSADVSYQWRANHKTNLGALAEQAEIPKASAYTNYDPIDFHYLGGMRELTDPVYRFVEDRQRRLSGVYLQDQYSWTETLHTTLGLRHDRYNDIGGSTNPRAALIYQPALAHTLKLMWGKAFRAPGLGDLYDREAGQTLGNADLGPIKATTTEFAYLYRGDNWFSGLTLFDNHIENLLATVDLPDGRTQISNVGRNDSQGAEYELSYAPSERWLLKMNITHIARNKTTDIPDPGATIAENYAPKNYAALMLNWQHERWNISLNGFWREQIPVLKDDAAQHLNLAVSYDLKQAGQLQLKLWNALDDDYFIPARGSALGRNSDGERVREVPTRGRQAMLSYSLRF